jgi:phenolic acid decarboxylase
VPNSEQALRDGQVDIQFFTAAFWGQAQAEGGVTEVFNALTGPGFDHELLDMFFDRDFVANNPEVFCAWQADYVASNAAFIADRDSFGQVLIDEGYDPAPSAEIFAARPDAGRSADAAIDLANVQKLIDNMRDISFLPADLEVVADDIVMEGFSLTK